MKELFAWIKKYKVQVILALALALSLCGLCLSIQKNIDNAKASKHNIEALTDSIRYYKGKNGELVASKAILVGDMELLKQTNEELAQKIKDMNLSNPNQVIYVETEIVNEVHDTVWAIEENDTITTKEFDFSNQWRTLTGTIKLDHKLLSLSIDQDKTLVNYTLAVKDGRVYMASDNPYIQYNEIQGFTIPQQKKKHFSLGIGPSLTYGYDIANRKQVFCPGISVGLYWNIIQF